MPRAKRNASYAQTVAADGVQVDPATTEVLKRVGDFEQEVAVVISPPPKPLAKPAAAPDEFETLNATMRARGSELYHELQAHPVDIRPEIASTVLWLRGHGVRIKAVMRPEGTLYVLEGTVHLKTGVFTPHEYPKSKAK